MTSSMTALPTAKTTPATTSGLDVPMVCEQPPAVEHLPATAASLLEDLAVHGHLDFNRLLVGRFEGDFVVVRLLLVILDEIHFHDLFDSGLGVLIFDGLEDCLRHI